MVESAKKGPRRVLSVFVLAMLNVSIMASLRSLPLVAEYSLSAIAYFVVVALFFLIPCALVSAELATGWPKAGGIYIWVREAVGDRWGFFSVWIQWIHSVAWYPVILSFVAATMAYVINPALAHNKFYILSVILASFWGMTLLNYLGIQTSSWFSTIGVILGTIAPGILIISLGFSWLLLGHPSQIPFTWGALVPDLSNLGNLVFLTGLFLAFAGLEVSAAHAAEVKNPQKNYPIAIGLAALITFLVFMLGALSIAIVIPREQISLVSGVMEAFETFFNAYGMQAILPIIAILLVVGAVAEINSWIVGPIRALHATSIHGNLPPLLQKVNSHGMPVNLLLLQGLIVTAVSFVFLFMPTISSSFWILTVLSAQSYLIMYLFMFLSAIVLRYTRPHVPRTYKIAHENRWVWLVASVGIFASLAGIALGFVPPTQIQSSTLLAHVGFLSIGLGIMCAIPLIIHAVRQPGWVDALHREPPKTKKIP